MVTKLYFSIISSILFIALKENDTLLTNFQKENEGQHSENFIKIIEDVLDEKEKKLDRVEEIYFLSGPGSQTGIRISLTFVSVLLTLNKNVKIYHLNSLLLQANKKENCISLLSLDKSSRRFHLTLIEKGKAIINSQIKNKEEIEEIKKKYPFLVLVNFKEFNFYDNFEKMLTLFQPFNEKTMHLLADTYL